MMIIFYHAVVFSDFVPDITTQFTMGYSYLSFIGVLILVNILFIID